VISPHLDDAVLSLGGLIGREVAAGRRVEVWSCFTAGPPLDVPAEGTRDLEDSSRFGVQLFVTRVRVARA